MTTRRRTPKPPGTLEIVLVRTFALIRQTRLERIDNLTVTVSDHSGQRWSVRIGKVKKGKDEK